MLYVVGCVGLTPSMKIQSFIAANVIGLTMVNKTYHTDVFSFALLHRMETLKTIRKTGHTYVTCHMSGPVRV
jgi:hypothetical protein